MANEITTQKDNYDLELLRKIFNVDDDVPEDQIRIAEQYCKAKGLDPIKKPIAIIPFTKKFKDNKNVWHEKKEYQIIPTAESVKVVASRANWAGNDDYINGPEKTFTHQDKYKGLVTITVPEWGQVCVYKIVGGVRCAFMGPKVYFEERCSFNSNWIKQPMAMLNKCVLTAALRNACPEECAGMYIGEELNDDRYQEKMPYMEQVKLDNARELTEEEEAEMHKGLEKLKEENVKPQMTATEAKARAASRKIEEPEIIEATAKELFEETSSTEIADGLVSMIETALESTDDDISVELGKVELYKTKKLSNPKYTTVDDHNRIAMAFLDLKKKKGIE